MVQAVPVADEPTPFWDGADADDRIRQWRDDVGFERRWGIVDAPPNLNGPSGIKVHEMVLAPLRLRRPDVWITDCLDTYRASDGVAAALESAYIPLGERLGLPAAALLPHPTEAQILAEAVAHHRDRLRQEITMCEPELIVTLGNAALRTLRTIANTFSGGPPGAGLSLDGYPHPGRARVERHDAEVLPFVHPGAPGRWRARHAAWLRFEESLGRRASES